MKNKTPTILALVLSLLVINGCHVFSYEEGSSSEKSKTLFVLRWYQETESVYERMAGINLQRGEELDDSKWELYNEIMDNQNFLLGESYVLKLRKLVNSDNSVHWNLIDVQLMKPNFQRNNEFSESLLNGKWSLKSIIHTAMKDNGTKKARIPTLKINAELMAIHGKDGCNTFFGSIENIDEERLDLNIGMGTLVYCGKDFIDDEFRSLIEATRGYSVDDSVLKFLNNRGSVLLEFERSR